MSSFSIQVDQAGSGTKRKLLEERAKNEVCVSSENCGHPTTIEAVFSNGQTVPFNTAALQLMTAKDIDINESCTIRNGEIEIKFQNVNSIFKEISDTYTNSNLDFSESIAPTEHPVAEKHSDDFLSWIINVITEALSNAAEVEDGHKTGGKDEEIACSGKVNKQQQKSDHPKVPRPLNAFMFFSNEWRKKLAIKHPEESNKQISVRLGAMWNTMEGVQKDKYFACAHQAGGEHKKKYPDYVYNPKEIRLQKRLREQKLRRTGRQLPKRRLTTAQAYGALLLPAEEHQLGGTTGTQGVAASKGQKTMKMLEMMPISPESTVLPIPVSTIPPPTTTTTTRTAHNAGNEEQQTTVASRNKSSDNPPPSNTRPSTAENIPLPDFGSPEFNPYSKEEFLDATQEEGIQQFINIEIPEIHNLVSTSFTEEIFSLVRMVK
ncbi:transcription factor Sox-11-like isoform X2 [Zootermopsis nevadensis]|uniref:transcription factor Sox-11-like isoform X2 n=1 Tax=Zootermopsis nevadensis TaxID=136037 RepID=UPI000B8E690E|nr:transcription factor Sox-11-like isoform X2 [Zootermopsis nevadensis]